MMSPSVKVNPVPFIFADVCLLAVAGAVILLSPAPVMFGAALAAIVAVAAGGVLCVLPWILEYRASLRMAEAAALAEAISKVKDIETVAAQINSATGHWQTAHEHANKTVNAAGEIARQIAGEARAFSDFMQKANDSEKSHLRLEVEKLRRAEGDWLQILVVVLDHVFALYQGALRSGQAALIEQIGQFQAACREAARRIGLVPFTANTAEPFDSTLHEPFEGNSEPSGDALVADTVAAGYRFQGQIVRRAIVALRDAEPVAASSPEARPDETRAARPAPADSRKDDGSEPMLL